MRATCLIWQVGSFVSNIKVGDATANAIKSVKIDKALAPVADFKLADGSKVAEKAAALRESLLAKQDKEVVPRSRRDLGASLPDDIFSTESRRISRRMAGGRRGDEEA